MATKTNITGDWAPVPKYLRNNIMANHVTWKVLSDATGIHMNTLAGAFKGIHKPPFETLERVANAMGFHLVLVPMTDEEKLTLEAGTYESPICMERKELK